MDDSSSQPYNMSRRLARRVERTCCNFITYVPLIFVYGVTSWAAWVIVVIGSSPSKVSWLGTGFSLVGVIIYLLLNWSYTTAVFTHPGSTTKVNGEYSALERAPEGTSFTVKSNGEVRFCKKCQARKPDRAHHCSTCRRCVLKMDHHCPWLATCIGLRNQKAFVLFLAYTTLLCWYGFFVSGAWFWVEIIDSSTTHIENLMPVNYALLCVMSGVIGIVVGAFTIWHFILAARGQTTIECLEKTRYLSPLRKSMRSNNNHLLHPGSHPDGSYGQQLLDIHAGSPPGTARPEEGEGLLRSHLADDSASRPLRLSYQERERLQTRKRYEDYLDEIDSEKLPHAFDLGWRQNYTHLFGPSPWLWALPVGNTTGDGWSWEPSPEWSSARDRLRTERVEQRNREVQAGWGPSECEPPGPPVPSGGAGRHFLSRAPPPRPSPPTPPPPGGRVPSKADRVLGRDPNLYADGVAESVSLRTLDRKGRTVDDDLFASDNNDDDDEDNDGGDDHVAERPPARAPGMKLGSWQASGAIGILRKSSPTTSRGGAVTSMDDDTVD